MEKRKGFVEHIIFRNEENGYTVLNLSCEGEEFTCVGILPFLSEGEMIEAEGNMTTHASYGEQFRIERYQTVAAEDEEAIRRYLGSGAIKGIGLALADRIVRRFHEDTFRIIEEEPERLAEVKGISLKKAREIAEQTEEKREMRDVMMFLAQFGISNALSVKLHKKYGAQIYHIIRENPYKLADEVEGVGFKIADDIARKAGISVDSHYRICSGILYVLSQAAGEGHMFLPAEKLLERVSLLLNVELRDGDDCLRDMLVDKKIVIRREEDEIRVYAQSMFYVENHTARLLNDLNIVGEIDPDRVRERIAAIEKEQGTALDPMQAKAVMEAVRCGLSVLTGGPGTGKTTTINTMISYFEAEGLTISLAAPTGRAAKRMSEATGCEAKTLHRLLEVEGGPEGGGSSFGRNAENPLEADVIIVDEMSMVDIFLFHALLGAIVPGTRLVMVGDANQLPSVGPGCVLKDIISSGICSVVELKHIFRQAEESDIVVNAHRINRGEQIVLDNRSRDFFFLQRDDANRIISIAIQLVSEKLPRYVNAEPKDIQVLTPTRKGLLGVERLNRILQEYLNPKAPRKKEYTRGENLFREGDKVMQIKNNYQLEWEVCNRYGIPVEKGTGVFNGDTGIVKEINEYSETMTVEFDEGRLVEYPLSGLEELELAYAVTIHKSQGSEYPAVVIPLLGGPKMLLNRNLIYTAVTRARKSVVLVGDKQVFYDMVNNTTQQMRYSALSLRLREAGESRTDV